MNTQRFSRAARRCLFSLILPLVLAACTILEPPEPTPAPTPTPAPPTATPLPRGGNLTIRLAADVPDLRPWQPRTRGEEQINGLLYNGLVRLDQQLRPEPDLATGWDASADGRLITVTLRSGVTWHDGQPFGAPDVLYTLQALRELSPTTALLSGLRRIAEVSNPMTDTVVLSLTERFSPLISMLAVPMLPRHLLIGKNLESINLWDTPIGTGPFRFAERQPGQSITLAANQDYIRGEPLLDRVAFIVAPDPQVALDALADGRLLLAELPWETARRVTERLPNAQTGSYAENAFYYLAFNLREGRPFADLRLRQALALALDRPALVDTVTDGQGLPINSSVPPGSWADVTPAPTTTVDLARAGVLLDEAGWKINGEEPIRQRDTMSLTVRLFVRGDDPRRVQAAEQIAEAARALGMELLVEQADFGTVMLSKFAPPYDFDLLLGSWSNGVGDPNFSDYAFYDPDDFDLFHSSQINQGSLDIRPVLNIVGFNDSAYDNQAGAARQLYGLDERTRAIRLAQQRIAEQLPYLFLWTDRLPVALNPRLTTLDGPINLNTPMYLWQIERWYLLP